MNCHSFKTDWISYTLDDCPYLISTPGAQKKNKVLAFDRNPYSLPKGINSLSFVIINVTYIKAVFLC